MIQVQDACQDFCILVKRQQWYSFFRLCITLQSHGINGKDQPINYYNFGAGKRWQPVARLPKHTPKLRSTHDPVSTVGWELRPCRTIYRRLSSDCGHQSYRFNLRSERPSHVWKKTHHKVRNVFSCGTSEIWNYQFLKFEIISAFSPPSVFEALRSSSFSFQSLITTTYHLFVLYKPGVGVVRD